MADSKIVHVISSVMQSVNVVWPKTFCGRRFRRPRQGVSSREYLKLLTAGSERRRSVLALDGISAVSLADICQRCRKSA